MGAIFRWKIWIFRTKGALPILARVGSATTSHMDTEILTRPVSLSPRRKSGSNPREILKSFVEKLDGLRLMGMSNERNDGLEHRNSFMMSKKHPKDICR